jgi:hypothetical protein
MNMKIIVTLTYLNTGIVGEAADKALAALHPFVEKMEEELGADTVDVVCTGHLG